jgi:outer membrane immunogenic protein
MRITKTAQQLLIAGSTLLAITGVASAADMAVKAPALKAAPAANWTGCYVAGGGGYGMWNQDSNWETNPGHVAFYTTTTAGGRGWFGTVGAGCDYQFSPRWVLGAFGDYDFSDIKGTHDNGVWWGNEKQQSAWSIGGRLGYLITPDVLTYFSGGFTQARFGAVDVFSVTAPGNTPIGLTLPATTYSGYFLGGGFEYNLGWLPGLNLRTEYRYAQYDNKHIPYIVTATGAQDATGVLSQKFTQTVRTELVWRWNGR